MSKRVQRMSAGVAVGRVVSWRCREVAAREAEEKLDSGETHTPASASLVAVRVKH